MKSRDFGDQENEVVRVKWGKSPGRQAIFTDNTINVLTLTDQKPERLLQPNPEHCRIGELSLPGHVAAVAN